MVSKITSFQCGETQAKTRLLLALWDLGGTQQEIKKGLLTKRILTKGKKAADYHSLFEDLQNHGVIAGSKQGYFLTSPKGLEVLGEGLRTGNFQFEGTIVGTWAANALLKWISQINVSVTEQAKSVNGVKSATGYASYDEFKSTVLEVYDKLNYEYNFNHLVPIYRIRREIGDRLNRTQFNDWLLEMQADDILQLQGGSVEDSAPDKIEDSITTVLDGLRCYAKLLKV
ncbi:hypothetical protein ACN23B_21595 [Anabaena sp. FACHB-709]|uniref:Uncharacterized protein n=2 Tax=Nostocaceae TaxID=1162 RepID=A0A1Z4KLS5_ANAVA|nr:MULTISPECIES: hypothetical protein [Nostocaceae]BAY69917.1 hypothetical protein NIES23_27170 [Trichormus variabilis NIES-23]HBW33399.1 hypothetical protein [Nostoc sp. UBA8866]MBD2173628.1 hypothetical protein [Anabaena cylindrica FACHB-318]MBD2265293.1 hypothetical protein [Anabaena sp. FACHB-709]MBD2275285.1 hypothetical protein [Nostoc sp. PCC 7120 = FACHB-418]